MSGEGAPERLHIAGAADLRVGIVAGEWHEQVSEALLNGAVNALQRANIDAMTVVRVNGAFELPIVARAFAQARFDAIVALACVVRGGTPHFEYVCRAVTDGLQRVALDTGIPVGFGVLTVDTIEQALERAGLATSHEDKGSEAAMAAVSTAIALKELRRGTRHPGTD